MTISEKRRIFVLISNSRQHSPKRKHKARYSHLANNKRGSQTRSPTLLILFTHAQSDIRNKKLVHNWCTSYKIKRFDSFEPKVIKY